MLSFPIVAEETESCISRIEINLLLRRLRELREAMAGWSAAALVAGMVLLFGVPYGALSAGYVRPPPRGLVSVPRLHGSSQPEQVDRSLFIPSDG